jgi:site-specific DNA-methyltransferase (cytosine-N4-specific)
VTRLSHFHPYPAMVADELAVALAKRFVRKNIRVLDPFCGAGRLIMAAAAEGASCTAFDRNPLACLITTAKSVRACPQRIASLISDIPHARGCSSKVRLTLREDRKVPWFSRTALKELTAIVGWINGEDLPPAEKWVVAAALSVTVRKSSFCRKDGWKLHRMTLAKRDALQVSPWAIFEQKLNDYAKEAARPPTQRCIRVGLRDVRELANAGTLKPFDLVMTSPPYGDSRTTIQYGAASAFCLDVVSHIEGLEALFERGRVIDDACLGGALSSEISPCGLEREAVRHYWAGSQDSDGYRRIFRFLYDMKIACQGIANVVTRDGTIVVISGRRSVGGFRLKLDAFIVDQFRQFGFLLQHSEIRSLKDKRMPRKINRFGAATSACQKAAGSTLTMLDEYVLTLKRSLAG